MRGKILFAAGLAVGYVFGTRAGRERYEQLKSAAVGFWKDPREQQRVDQVQDFVKDKVPEVGEFLSDGAKKVVDQVTGRGATKPSTASGAAKPAASSSTTAKKPASKPRTASSS